MWAEAVARSGSPARVVLRGTSIGTLAAAHLLAQGAEPAATILIAPVRGESAVRHFATYRHNRVVAWLADFVFADMSNVDLAAELERSSKPLLVVSGVDDLFLSQSERASLRRAAVGKGGSWRDREGTHARITIEAHTVLPEELSLLAEVFPDLVSGSVRATQMIDRMPTEVAARFARGSAARERLEAQCRFANLNDPLLVAAAALGNADPQTSARYLWPLRDRPCPPLSFEELVEVVSLEDPAGPLSVASIEQAGFPMDILERFGGGLDPHYSPSRIALAVAAVAEGRNPLKGAVPMSFSVSGAQGELKADGLGWGYSLDLGWDTADDEYRIAELWQRLGEDGLADADARRQAARILLKAFRIPDRVRRDAHGQVTVEVKRQGQWRLLELELERPRPDPEEGIVMHGTFGTGRLGKRAKELKRSADRGP